ncbi:MAG: hypothetical protein J5980_11870 [Muribaculaceae bacterium]|nr:hypothetical protein [Muribaculaceae bacterium]
MQGNQTLSIAEAGKYNVTFTLTLGEENVLTATAEKIEEQPVEITSYTIVGDSALVGAAWNPELTDNDMAASVMSVPGQPPNCSGLHE